LGECSNLILVESLDFNLSRRVDNLEIGQLLIVKARTNLAFAFQVYETDDNNTFMECLRSNGSLGALFGVLKGTVLKA